MKLVRGGHKYVVRFKTGELPTADGFWTLSITIRPARYEKRITDARFRHWTATSVYDSVAVVVLQPAHAKALQGPPMNAEPMLSLVLVASLVLAGACSRSKVEAAAPEVAADAIYIGGVIFKDRQGEPTGRRSAARCSGRCCGCRLMQRCLA